MTPIYPTPATPSGTSFRSDKTLPGGVVIPLPPIDVSKLKRPQLAPNSTSQRAQSFVHSSPPATLSSIEARVPDSYFPAQIVKPLTLTPSVAGTIYNATPLSNITSVATDIRSGVRGRPLIPVGLRDRAADAMPPGIRQRAAAWNRAVARFRSPRPTSGGRVHRE